MPIYRGDKLVSNIYRNGRTVLSVLNKSNDLFTSGSTPTNEDPVISNRSLTTSSLSETGFLVDYTEATDDTTSQENLVYTLYSSYENNIGTITNAESNGTVQDSGSGISTLSISGLASGQTVWFNIIVEDEEGNKAIYTQSSQTTPDETSPTVSSGSLSFSNITQTSVTIGFTKATDQVTAQADLVYKLYRASEGTNISNLSAIDLNGTLIDTQTDVSSFNDSGLSIGTYEYNVTVEDTDGNRTPYTQNTLVISDENSPTVSNTSLTKSNVTSSGFDVSFTQATDDVSSNLTYYLYTVTGDSTVPFDTISDIEQQGTLKSQGSNISQLSATGFNEGDDIIANVIVEDEEGNKSIYQSISVTTLDITAPTITNSSLQSSNVGETAFNINFNAASDNIDEPEDLRYYLYISSTDNISTDVSSVETNGELKSDNVNVSSLTASGLTADTTYYYNILVEDTSGNKSIYTSSSVTTSPIPVETEPPTISDRSLVTADVTSSGFLVFLNKATDNVTAQENLIYKLYISDSSNLDSTDASVVETNGAKVDEGVDVPSLAVVNQQPGNTIYFNITVEDEAGNKSTYAQGSQLIVDQIAPEVLNPELSISGLSTSGFNVNYINATDNVTARENLKYYLYTSTQDNLITNVSNVESNGSLKDEVTGTAGTLSVAGLFSGETYYYNIVVEDESGNKSIYNSGSVTTASSTESYDLYKSSFDLKVIDKFGTSEVIVDEGFPTVSNPTITADQITTTGFTANFAKASDDQTFTSDLVYYLYTSENNNVGIDAATVIANGTLQSQGTDVTSLVASGLTSFTEYFYNIVVEDEDTNKSIYNTNSVTTASDTAVDLPAPTGLSVTGTDTVRPTFSWNELTGADSYLIHASQGPEMTIDEVTPTNSYTPDYDMTTGTHHWRVRGISNGVEGDWSEILDFTITI